MSVHKTLTRIVDVFEVLVFEGNTVIVTMQVEPLNETKKVAKIFRHDEWEKIEADGYYYEEKTNE